MIDEINASAEELEYEVEEILQKIKQKKVMKWKIKDHSKNSNIWVVGLTEKRNRDNGGEEL